MAENVAETWEELEDSVSVVRMLWICDRNFVESRT